MADLIEREYGTKRLKNEYCTNCTRRGNYEIFGAACKTCWVMDCIEEFENAPAVNRWIPCSERMPEYGLDVLVYSKAWEEHIQVAHIQYDGIMWELSDGEYYFSQSDVSHWMPLPEPPEKE